MDIKTPIRKIILWARFDRIINMTPAEINAARNSEEAKDVSQDLVDARKVGANVKAGREESKKIEAILRKVSKYRGQYKKVPNLTDSEWDTISSAIRFISRARANIGPLRDSDGKKTKKAWALNFWGRNETESSTFPNKNAVKTEVSSKVHAEKEKQKEKEKKESKKLNEDFFSKYFILI